MVYIDHYKNVEGETYDGGDVDGVKKRVLIGDKQNAPNFIMRHFTVEGGGHSPFHAHSHEHEAYILVGRGKVKSDNGDREIKPGDFVYVPPNERHQFVNTSPEPLKFLCIIPKSAG